MGWYSTLEASSYAFVASRHNLGCYKIIFWETVDSDFDNALDGLRGAIPDFDVSSFTSKDTVPPKAQYVLASALFSKSVQDMEVKFNWPRDRRQFLDVCKHHMLRIFF